MDKPTLPKGTRDFGPAVMAKRQFIFNTIRSVFQKFGFQPLETPSMENLSTLTGKYGEEGDQLLFKILDSGDFIKDARKLIEFDLLEWPKIEQILKDLTQRLESKKNEDKFSFSLEFLPLIIAEIEEIILRIDFSISPFGEDLKNFIQTQKVQIAYDIISNPNDFSNNEESALKQFFKNVYMNVHLIATRFKTEFDSKKIVSLISEKGLRYDLTVPFARYVVMNRNEISFPFKRYQIQPVWRADRPQKGRYREFYQCDADVVGTDSLICEAEIILMIKEVFKNLAITDYTIKINHRGILSGIAELAGASGNETPLFVAIDKLDKIGEDGVKAELSTKGFSEENLSQLFHLLNVKGSNTDKISFLSAKFEKSTNGQKGLSDLNEVINLLTSYQSNDEHVEFDVSLARGLSYYTGCIFEVKINNVSIGSVSGGGRYDNLTQAFGDKENLSGVGFSFGVDRLYDAMEALQIFPKDSSASSKVLICHFDPESMQYGLNILTKLREKGIASEIYPDQVKLKKQLEYANKKSIPYTLVIGSDEIKTGLLAFKDMERGEQEKLSIDQILLKLQ